MPIPIRQQGCLVKIESVYGTDSVPVVGSDGVRVTGFLWGDQGMSYAWENSRRDVVNASLFPNIPGAPHGRIVEMDLRWEVKGAGSDIQVEAAPLIRACGWAEVDGTLKFTYTLALQPHDSCTIYVYAGGYLFRIVGCRGVLRWPHVPGENGVMHFAMKGLLITDPVASAATVITSYDATAPIASVAYGLTVGAFSPDVIAAEFNQGSTLDRLDSLNATDGIREFDWAIAEPMITLSNKVPMTAGGIADTATYDPYADAKVPTGRTIAWTQGSTQFNRVKMSAPGCYVQIPKHANQQNYAGHDLTYRCTDATTSIVTD
jgi:hypothetical protein